MSLTPPPFPSRPLPITVPNTVPLHLNGLNLPARVKTAQRWVSPQHPKFDTGTGGKNVNYYFVPLKGPQTSSDARKPSTSNHSQLHVPMRPPVPTRPLPSPPQSDCDKHQQLFAVKLRELQTQVAALEEEFNRALGSAKSNKEIQKAIKKYHNRIKDLWSDSRGELDESDSDNETNPAPSPVPPRPVRIKPMPAARDVSHRHDSSAAPMGRRHRHRGRPTDPKDNMLVDPFVFTSIEGTQYDAIEKVTAGVSICHFLWVGGGELICGLQKKNIQPEPQFPTYREVGSTIHFVCDDADGFDRTLRLIRMPSVHRKRRKRGNMGDRRIQCSVEGVHSSCVADATLPRRVLPTGLLNPALHAWKGRSDGGRFRTRIPILVQVAVLSTIILYLQKLVQMLLNHLLQSTPSYVFRCVLLFRRVRCPPRRCRIGPSNNNSLRSKCTNGGARSL